jgi:uncharacterized membrane protein
MLFEASDIVVEGHEEEIEEALLNAELGICPVVLIDLGFRLGRAILLFETVCKAILHVDKIP